MAGLTTDSQSPNRLPHQVLFLFVDGVGLARPGPANPLSQVPMPEVHKLLGRPLVLNGASLSGSDEILYGVEAGSTPAIILKSLDACLGVPGLPQSATGQTALFTGINAPALVGGHITALPTRALRQVIAEHSLLKRAAAAGGRVILANAHSEQFWRMVRAGKRRLGASTLTAQAAGARIPNLEDLAQGRAVLWDITHEIATRHLDYELAEISPQEAGARLARMATEYDLVMYETFLTDLAGHRRLQPEWVLARLDAFLGAVLDHRPLGTTVVLCSDHGNIEDTTTKAHTINPVPLLAAGPAADRFSAAVAITDVAPIILSILEQNHGQR